MTTVETFIGAVVEQFALGGRDAVEVTAMTGSSNRLWRFGVGAEHFVVKELSHVPVGKLDRRRRAASFERALFDARALPMPEPLVDRDGEIVAIAPGSRGGPCLVRVHRWITGRPPTVTAALARTAGATLAVIQAHGRDRSTAPSGSLGWWDVDPVVVAGRLDGSPLQDVARRARELLASGFEVIDAAESMDGEWVFSHVDHKPENSLEVEGGLAVLDWDEAGLCHPRLEAVESALRWSMAAPSASDPAAMFRSFLDGYGGVAALEPRDFGKWLAALVGWFSFQARRTMGDWPTDTAADRVAAEAMARDALVQLERALASLSVWSSWA